MVSNLAGCLFLLSLLLILVFLAWSLGVQQQRHLLHNLYIALMLTYAVWAIALLAIWITPPSQLPLIQALDAIAHLGTGVSSFYLMIAIVFVRGYERLPRYFFLLLVPPVLSFLLCLTNDLHHLYYLVFSATPKEIIFGPFVLISSLHSFICYLVTFALLISFIQRNPGQLYLRQCLLLLLGGLIPLVVSLLSGMASEPPVTATPLSFLPTLLCNGIAIYRFNLLNITPVATQHILDRISDCYLVVSSTDLVLSFNAPFRAVFADRYGIAENRPLRDCMTAEDVSQKTALYNIVTALDTCRATRTTISFEQAATVTLEGVTRTNHYITDVSPLMANQRLAGFVVIFKDVTQLKKSMRQLQDSRRRMMEQERFAFLGQMMGGVAHNLKTPIMSISGCVSALEDLLEECESSLEDPAVTTGDYREIYAEARSWFRKIQDSTAYMSDIITTIKGQASSVCTFEESFFSLEELIRRTTLLMRHELMHSGCILETKYSVSPGTTLHGDINTLVQVLGNLVTNAIHAQTQVGGGTITVILSQDENKVNISVSDTGPGISPSVRDRLFREMVTSKGAQGSGLGLYISNTVVQGKFGGSMWCGDNPGGGAIFGITLPLQAPDPLEAPTLSIPQKEAPL